MMDRVDLIIIGAGPAGLMAAIQAKRQGIGFIIFEKSKPGGQALAANLIENFPGILEGIKGVDLMQRFIDQAKAHKIDFCKKEIVSLRKDNDFFQVLTNDLEYSSRCVILATGLIPKTLNVPYENELLGKKVFSYINPEELSHASKEVLVIGGGDAAFDQALNFSRKAVRVTIAMKFSSSRCAPLLLERARLANVDILYAISATEFIDAGDKINAVFSDGSKISADYVITCIGKKTSLDFIDRKLLEDSASGILFAGDCHRGIKRHIAIACGDGTAAAMEASEYLSK